MPKGGKMKTVISVAGKLDASLGKTFDAAASRLTTLQKAMDMATTATGKLSAKISYQSEELSQAKKKYMDYYLSGQKNSKAAKEQAEKIKKLTGELKDNEKKMTGAQKAADKLAGGLDDVGESAKKSGGGFTVMKGALSNLVSRGFEVAIDKAKEFSSSMIGASAEVKAETSQFEQTFSGNMVNAVSAIDRVATESGILDTRLNGTAVSIYAFAKSSGASTEEAMSLMETSLQAAADSAAYYDTSLEDAGDTLMSFLKGNFANDAALGLSATETTRNAKAAELFGKKYNELSEIQKQQTLLKMVTDSQKLSGAMGQAAREADGWENVQGNLSEAWRQFQSNVGAPFLEQLIPIIQDVTGKLMEMTENIDWDAFGGKVEAIAGKVGDVLTKGVDFAKDGMEKLSTAIQWVKDNADWLVPIVAGLTGALVAYKTISLITATATWAVNTATKVLGGAMSFLTSPVGLAVLAIGALIAIGVALYKNWDTVKEYAAKLGEFLSGVWTGIKDGVGALIGGIKDAFITGFSALVGIVKGPVNAVIGIVNGAINGINKIGFNIPDWVPIIGGKKFALNIPNLPMLASGGFTNGPSIAGEAGREAVISFDPNYRSENLSYWAEAGRMLGADQMSLGNSANETNIDMSGIQFSPQITVEGNADKQDIIEAIEEAYPDFVDLLERFMSERGKLRYV